MEKLIRRGEEIAARAQERKIDEMAGRMAALLPKAEIEMLMSGFSVRDALLFERWLDDPELRFLGRTK